MMLHTFFLRRRQVRHETDLVGMPTIFRVSHARLKASTEVGSGLQRGWTDGKTLYPEE